MADVIARMFTDGRTHSFWKDVAVPHEMLERVYDLARMGPTSVNCQPARFVFLTTPEAKARLLPALWPANVDKVRTAPVTAIVASDTRFHEHVPRLFPHRPEAAEPFAADPALTRTTAERNATLQGGYFLLAARALGLDCGPMSGFDNSAVDREFFPDGRLRSDFLINLGHGEREKLFPRLPRLSFEEACSIL